MPRFWPEVWHEDCGREIGRSGPREPFLSPWPLTGPLCAPIGPRGPHQRGPRRPLPSRRVLGWTMSFRASLRSSTVSLRVRKHSGGASVTAAYPSYRARPPDTSPVDFRTCGEAEGVSARMGARPAPTGLCRGHSWWCPALHHRCSACCPRKGTERQTKRLAHSERLFKHLTHMLERTRHPYNRHQLKSESNCFSVTDPVASGLKEQPSVLCFYSLAFRSTIQCVHFTVIGFFLLKLGLRFPVFMRAALAHTSVGHPAYPSNTHKKTSPADGYPVLCRPGLLGSPV